MNNKKMAEFLRFWRDFRTGWLLVSLLFIAAICSAFGFWILARVIGIIALLSFFGFFLAKPMNAVYGFIGTRGDIVHFVRLIVLINFIFSGIYFYGFFRNAGITYDTSQPYVSYGMFKNFPKDSVSIMSPPIKHKIKGDSGEEKIVCQIVRNLENNDLKDTITFCMPSLYYEEEHTYQRYNKSNYWIVLQNTLLTSLIQEPTDLFSACVNYVDINQKEEQNLNGCNDKAMSRLFSWVLVLQVFISWIFFGVFISILYNKFRYES